MSARSRYEDATTLLYLVPFIGSIGYAIALWVQTGLSATLPASVFLTVTRDPDFFMIASLAVLLGIMIEMNSTEPAGRAEKVVDLGATVQYIAIGSLVISLLSAWYANGFTDLGGTGTDFVVGRYDLVFPALMVLLSYLLTSRFRLQALFDRRVAGLVAMLLVPATVYEIGKRQAALGAAISFVLILVGLFLLLSREKGRPAAKEE